MVVAHGSSWHLVDIDTEDERVWFWG